MQKFDMTLALSLSLYLSLCLWLYIGWNDMCVCAHACIRVRVSVLVYVCESAVRLYWFCHEATRETMAAEQIYKPLLFSALFFILSRHPHALTHARIHTQSSNSLWLVTLSFSYRKTVESMNKSLLIFFSLSHSAPCFFSRLYNDFHLIISCHNFSQFDNKYFRLHLIFNV